MIASGLTLPVEYCRSAASVCEIESARGAWRRKWKTPPASENADGVFRAFTSFWGYRTYSHNYVTGFSFRLDAPERRFSFVPLVSGSGLLARTSQDLPKTCDHNVEITSEYRNDRPAPMLPFITLWRTAMSKLGIIGASALSLALAAATPAFAQRVTAGGGGAHVAGGGGGMHVGGGGMRVGGGGGMRGGAASIGAGRVGSVSGGNFAAGGGRQFAQGSFRGAQANIAAGRVGSVSGGNFAAGGGRQFAQRDFRGDGFRGDRGWRRHGFGPGVGFAAGLAAGSALGYGYYGGYSDPYYYDDDYANSDYYDGGYPGYGDEGYAVTAGADPSYCAQRYRSYDPASGTYLGYDGLRHPCP
jgi:BA14K-like protein